jgi:hypothetical protein
MRTHSHHQELSCLQARFGLHATSESQPISSMDVGILSVLNCGFLPVKTFLSIAIDVTLVENQ